MLLYEVLKRTGLTRKAIEYYAAQGLIAPRAQENGYRDFDQEDVSRLEKIAAYRKLGVGVADIRKILSGDEKQVLADLLIRRRVDARRAQRKDELLRQLAAGVSISEIAPKLRALEAGESIAERLPAAFPGYFGRYFCLHFSQFLHSPIETKEQQEAYETIVRWLDQLPPLELDDDLKAFLDEVTQELGVEQMDDMITSVRSAIEQPERFLSDHEDAIRAYLSMKESEEYKASPAARLMEQMRAMQRESGYEDVFLPAMERLSPSYRMYREQLIRADEALTRMISGDQ